MQGLGLGGGLYCLVMPFANQTVHNCSHCHTLSLNQTSTFFVGILSLWRQKSNRSNNIRCALTGVHWESGLVTAHASIALRGSAQMFALETQSCESATTARGKVHHRQGHSGLPAWSYINYPGRCGTVDITISENYLYQIKVYS